MNVENQSGWTKKGGTLTDRTAENEFGLTHDEIVEAINEGKLQYRNASMYGNPCIKIIRTEVEEFVTEKYGADHLKNKNAKTELNKINGELRKLKRKIAVLEQRKALLSKSLDK
jgi:hypothetical protein